jgi:predicted aldo/keto reductase-like oxidoreductase
MKKARLGRTGMETGAIGLGLEHLEKAPYGELAAVVERALEAGMSYMDLFMPSAAVRDNMGKLMKGRRERFQVQGHVGACLDADGQYLRTREPATSERHAEDLLRRLGTDYLDVLMVHFVDEAPEWEEVSAPGGTLEIAKRWKDAGKARVVGLSSHKTGAAMRAVESGAVDVLMFPVNPLFDVLPGDVELLSLWKMDPYQNVKDKAAIELRARRNLFLECRRRGVAIVAMKPYAAGWAFKPDNPTGAALTPVQCIEYALTRPGVAVALAGCRTPAEVDAALAWLGATEAERDFGASLGKGGWSVAGACMYCNHCLPCPAGIDIAAVTRLLDAAGRDADASALAGEYGRLQAKASACVECGDCEARCPFGVGVKENMRRSSALFGG